jgi:hypothetical protein
MDRDATQRALKERFEQSLEQALDAVEQAPDGQWIAASEWQVRRIFQELMADSYQQLLQARMDAAPQAAFSPSAPA